MKAVDDVVEFDESDEEGKDGGGNPYRFDAAKPGYIKGLAISRIV